jgi:4-aminobutyrate aminotransferase-like enzyme/Ser/Thr protein kinase RdoA (MazF antagonist)
MIPVPMAVSLARAPRFASDDAVVIARDIYGITATATPLTSERDQNFLLDTPAGERFVLKIANAAEDRALLEAQNAAMTHVAAATGLGPHVVDVRGTSVFTYADERASYVVRLLTWVPGMALGDVRRRSPALHEDIGRRLGEIDRALLHFDHPAVHRRFHWDIAHASAVVRDCAPHLRDDDLRRRIQHWTAELAAQIERPAVSLRRSVIHDDPNDYNIIVDTSGDVWSRCARVSGIIDYGDIVHSFTCSDLAIAIAYLMLDAREPLHVASSLVRGYHSAQPLQEAEIAALFDLARLRLCASVAIAADQQRQRPDVAYLGVSQAPIARTLPALMAIPRGFAEAAFRQACGMEPLPASTRVMTWLASQEPAAVVRTHPASTIALDLSVGSPLVSGEPAENAPPALTARIAERMRDAGANAAIGRYREPRLLYTSPAFGALDDRSRRTVHLGVDVFAPPGTAVHAWLDGVIHLAHDNAAPLDYGPVVVLRHQSAAGDAFYTLYGHLSRRSLEDLPVGREIRRGEPFAAVGTADVNGGWTPHLHFQVIVDLLGLGADFPGVCRASELPVWEALSPDPGPSVVPAFTPAPSVVPTFRSAPSPVTPDAFPRESLDAAAGMALRRRVTGRNVSLGYREPLKPVRGWMQFLFDGTGRRYLDAYNNVPHVGHCHPAIVRAAAEQMRVLNTNTRYLHDSLARFAERLTATLPAPLRICYFVNSGSEANELALRLARAHTRRRNTIVLDAAYHGNTTTLVEISPYKFSGPGGEGAPSWVHTVQSPDVYRGPFTAADPDAGEKYAEQVAETVARLSHGGLCAFIAESAPSVGGQLILPRNYLARVYESVRAVGGVCIADEVQTAYGRTGTHFYAFEAQQVVPDIVVLGKPIGNGYPLGAVVTTTEIAKSFDNGMEFFSTFGGSTVSCAVGLAVLDVVQREGLQEHARRVGERMLDGLRTLAERHAIVGDVRGSGLFLGVELVKDRASLEPAADEASYAINRMREEGILIGTDGPWHNVLKIRPPMPFDDDDADRLVATLDTILAE